MYNKEMMSLDSRFGGSKGTLSETSLGSEDE